MDISRLIGECLLEPLSESALRNAILTLHRGFTTHRDRMAGYADKADLVSAYAAWYAPTNQLKLDFILRQPIRFPWADQSTIEVLDAGCGPGTFTFALSDVLPKETTWHLMDRSVLMLRQAEKIQSILYPEMKAFFHRRLPELSQTAFRLLVLGNVINEMPSGAVERLCRAVQPDAVLLIEPGTPESFVHTARIRRFMLRKGYSCRYPCPSDGRCPAEATATEWCHQVLRSSIHPELERIGQRVGLDRKVMPFIGHLYAREAVAPPGNAQLFRLRKNAKHAFLVQVCRAETTLQLQEVEIPKRNLSPSALRRLETVCAGEYLQLDDLHRLPNDVFRATIDIGDIGDIGNIAEDVETPPGRTVNAAETDISEG